MSRLVSGKLQPEASRSIRAGPNQTWPNSFQAVIGLMRNRNLLMCSKASRNKAHKKGRDERQRVTKIQSPPERS